VKRLALTTLLWLALPLATAAARVERYAIVIGNNLGAAAEVPLHYAEADASRVHEVLRELGGYEPANMVLLRGESADTARSTLIAFNDRIRQATSAADTDVMLFVYYSGHADGERLHMSGTALSMTELAQLVRGSAAQFRLVVLDACHSGALTRGKGARVRPPFALPGERSAGEGVAFLTASSESEDAQESDALHGSFFTHAFVSGLLGAADSDHDGRVVLEEAYRYAYEATLRATSRTLAGTQHASFRYDFSGSGDIVLTEPEAHRSERASLRFPARGEFLLMRDSDSGAVVAELTGHAENRRLSVRPGRYFVRMRTPDVLYEGTLDVAAGSSREVDVDVGGFTRTEYARLLRKGMANQRAVHGVESGFALRTPLPNESQACLGAFAGYALDLEYFGLGARMSGCTGSWSRGPLQATIDGYDVSGRIYRAWDWSVLAIELGLDVGAALFLQRFDTPGRAAQRITAAPLLGPHLSLSLDLGAGLFTMLDLAGETYLLNTQAPRQAATLGPHFALRSSLAIGKRL
jgi:hypothetical protein